jgi:predicted esterase
MDDDPHAGQPVLEHGSPLSDARLAVILVHGRGGSPDAMIALARDLVVADVAYFAPSASGGTWYPYSFLAPIHQNEPGLSSGLRVLSQLVDMIARNGLPHERVALLGFSQGACLALEFAARHARRYAGVIGLSGGIIGPSGTPRPYTGWFNDTPIFLGCSDVDAHVPLERVHESADVFRRLGAAVDERIYPQMGHIINQDELDAVKTLLANAAREAIDDSRQPQ